MSDKTYSETQGVPPLDWRHALNHPELYDPEKLSDLSASWVTCACGNQCAIIPRDAKDPDNYSKVQGMPMDPMLKMLGGDFHAHVHFKEWDNAKAILERIEARSAILIAEELAKLNAEPLHA